MIMEPFDSDGIPKKVIELRSPIIVKDLAALLGCEPVRIVADLLELKVMAHVDQCITFEVAARVAKKYGFDARKAG